LDTNGSNPEMLKELFQHNLLDFLAMDIKSSIKKYQEAIGQQTNLKNIQKSIDLIKKNKTKYEFRTTIVPGLIDKKEIKKIGQWLNGSKNVCFTAI